MCILLTILCSCHGGLLEECEVKEKWVVQGHTIVKKQCPDLVLSHFFRYEVSKDGVTTGPSAVRLDDCRFTWQATPESFLTLNVCSSSVQELKAHKVPLTAETIDSILVISRDRNESSSLSRARIQVFTRDWNNSKARAYSTAPFDSSFFAYPAYQYKLVVYSKGSPRPFYGYNYLILDSSNWEYEMSEAEDLNYFHSYWEN